MPSKKVQYKGKEQTVRGIQQQLVDEMEDLGLSPRVSGNQIEAEGTTVTVFRDEEGLSVRVKSESENVLDRLIGYIEPGIEPATATETVKDKTEEELGIHEETQEGENEVEISITKDDMLEIVDVSVGKSETFPLEVAIVAGTPSISEGPSAMLFSDDFDWTEEQIREFAAEIEESLMERT